MPLSKRQRRILAGLGLSLAGLLALWGSLPLWCPWVLAPLAQKQGIHYARYERAGYRRFVLHGIAFTNQTVSLHADRMEAWVPSVWLWRCAVGSSNASQPFLRVSGWRLEFATNGPSGDRDSIYTDAREIGAAVETLHKWLPTAVLSNGTLRAENLILDLPDATWSGGNIRAKVALPRQSQQLNLSAKFPERLPGGEGEGKHQGPGCEIQVQSESLHLQTTIQLSTDASGLKLQSTSSWWRGSGPTRPGCTRWISPSG